MLCILERIFPVRNSSSVVYEVHGTGTLLTSNLIALGAQLGKKVPETGHNSLEDKRICSRGAWEGWSSSLFTISATSVCLVYGVVPLGEMGRI